MSLQEVVESALNLDTVERRELVDALRASLEDSDVPPATAALIDERLAEARAHPERSTRLDEVERAMFARRSA
ncbi:MAG: addiction module protein [Galactobacter sp.]